MKCLVCNNENVSTLKLSEQAFYRCGLCSHVFRDSSEIKVNYSVKAGRNHDSLELESKANSRLYGLKKYLSDNKKIIEVGCAEGILAEKIKADYNVYYTGIEPSKDSMLAKERADEVYVGNFEEYISDKKYNLVLSYHVLEHVLSLQEFMLKLKEVAQDDVIIVLEVPNGISGSSTMPVDYNPEHINFFTVRSLVYLLERHGFEVIELTTGNYESLSYDDCIRVVAKKEKDLDLKINKYKQAIKSLFGERFSVYGAGGYFYDLLYPYLDEDQIIYIFDKDESKQGQLVYGTKVMNPEKIVKLDYNSMGNMLISSLDYYDEIKDYLISKHSFPEEKILSVNALFNKDKNKKGNYE